MKKEQRKEVIKIEVENCPNCGEKLYLKETPSLTHYGRLDCVNCGKWIKWVRNPEKPKYRDKTTKCKMEYDFCKICGRIQEHLGDCETLTAHHLKPLEEGGKDELPNLLVVCTSCHRMIHWLRLYTNKHLQKFYTIYTSKTGRNLL